MLLMIELFMGDYKGVGNDSAQEFHSIPETQKFSRMLDWALAAEAAQSCRVMVL